MSKTKCSSRSSQFSIGHKAETLSPFTDSSLIRESVANHFCFVFTFNLSCFSEQKRIECGTSQACLVQCGVGVPPQPSHLCRLMA